MSLKTRWEAWVNMEKPGDYLYGLYIANALEKECKPLFDIMDTPQDPKNHPEGSAGIHSIHAVDAMVRICREKNIIGNQRKLLYFAALLHDVGKAVTTKWNEKKNRWTAYSHDVAGVPIARKWLQELDWSENEINTVCALVRWHMIHTCQLSHHNEKNIRKIIDELTNNQTCYYELSILMAADKLSRPPLKYEMSDANKFLNEEVVRLYSGQSYYENLS